MDTEQDSPQRLCKGCQYFVLNNTDRTAHRCGLSNWREKNLTDENSFFELPIVSTEGTCSDWSQLLKPSYRSVLIKKLYGIY